MAIPIVYEDECLLVVNKPQGLLVIPAPGETTRTLTGILNEDLKRRAVSYRLHPCHRLDRETSGLIIYAKGKSVQKKLMDEFRYRHVRKKYIAFLQGILPKNEGKISQPIENSSAITEYKVIERRSNFTVIEAMPLTGRTNQIRIHFKNIGHPLVGETRFAFRRDFKLKAKRLCLHAGELEFNHPVTQEKIHLYAELSQDLKKFLEVNH